MKLVSGGFVCQWGLPSLVSLKAHCICMHLGPEARACGPIGTMATVRQVTGELPTYCHSVHRMECWVIVTRDLLIPKKMF